MIRIGVVGKVKRGCLSMAKGANRNSIRVRVNCKIGKTCSATVEFY